MKNVLLEMLFLNGFVLTGVIFLVIGIFSFLLSHSSSITLGIGKLTVSKSKASIRSRNINTYLFLAIGIVFLLIGFKDNFKTKQENPSRTQLPEPEQKFKKCSPYREGYRMCRTYDRKSTWVLVRQSDGAQLAKVSFEDYLEVVGIEAFDSGVAKVVGKPRSSNETVAQVDTLGKVSVLFIKN